MSLLLLNKDDNASLTAKSSKQLMCLVDSDLDHMPQVLIPCSICAPQPVLDASV